MLCQYRLKTFEWGSRTWYHLPILVGLRHRHLLRNCRSPEEFVESVGEMLQPPEAGSGVLSPWFHHSISFHAKLYLDAALPVLALRQGVLWWLPDAWRKKRIFQITNIKIWIYQRILDRLGPIHLYHDICHLRNDRHCIPFRFLPRCNVQKRQKIPRCCKQKYAWNRQSH